MIQYRFPEEQKILLYYTKKLNRPDINKILTKGNIETSAEGKKLAQFFWQMVDQTVIDSESDMSVLGYTGIESWCQHIMQTLRYHFLETGYISIWEDESENA
jgi:hypothetical protein